VAETIKAIQTHYNGYYFRSRLEARYAVLFDRLGIEYQYEAEGFELPEGRYLPDFWLPELEVYIEIKGTSPSQHEIVSCVSLCRSTYCDVLLFVGELIQEDEQGICPHYMWEYRRLSPFLAKILTDNPEPNGWTKDNAALAIERGGVIIPYKEIRLFFICARLGLDIRHASIYRDVMRSARFEFQNKAIS
jgi:hypothetical protein